VALYPAVPPGGSLIRTSVMATHERQHLDQALEIFEKAARLQADERVADTTS
jgi:8-amino-7-oxononanoate synthase